MYIGAAIEGMPVGRIARAFAQPFNTPSLDPEIISEDQIAAELGEWDEVKRSTNGSAATKHGSVPRFASGHMYRPKRTGWPGV